ncbi:mannitol-1-phosphate 5-dehydrogenase [Buchnera aphidicola (Diuraphis noxia)]|uniref:Mannitol-1-phosphate 5-dehydrogenase n=1 Tax=Buchnera aphidicola subsp. Diuraphis noxia TaxID=118101 RepID=A0A1B2H985_BUCDN|nr:mannitol-1-phosphate 5-dehydrogenase [Buchnera aphidicola]ANZ22747.1 mannitol-1-phosphate 5-dehydrogenase [Buchnera aphidicola (Diuraphis noxia)]
MKALHFGAGNIGLGFIGKTLSESNFDVIFSDINQDIINRINHHKNYFVRIVGKNKDKIFNIKNVIGVGFNDPDIVKTITLVDLITTSSGVSSLNKIASVISEGIILKCNMKSIKPLNIIACENKMKASSILKKMVLDTLPEKYYTYFKKYIGFVDCSIDTIIPYKKNQKKSSILIIAEDFQEWIVNITQFKGKIPKITNMKLSKNLDSLIERKLFTLNTGHAIAAYLGLIKTYQTVNEAILDKTIRFIVKSAMKESGNFLIKHYNFNVHDHFSYIDKIFFRFENPFLLDNLTRIARNPLQKLHKEERLVKPLLGCIQYGLSYGNLAKGIAAAFHYYNKNDLESLKISDFIKNQGIQKTLSNICGVSENSEEAHLIISEYNSILINRSIII